MSVAPSNRRDLLALLGAACAVASLALPYATLSGLGRTVSVSVVLDPRSPLFALPILVVGCAVLAALDTTRGEQLLGFLFALGLAAFVVGPLFVMDFSGWPGPGLALLFVGWLLVDAADNLDPALSNDRAPRWVPLSGLAVLGVAGLSFLWLHRVVVRTAEPTLVTAAWLVSGAIAVVAWLLTAAWEWTAERA